MPMIEQDYVLVKRKKKIFILTGGILLLILAYISVGLGLEHTPCSQVLIAIYRYASGTLEIAPDASTNKIIILLRLPRAFMAILAGMGLSFSGAIMQSITRNYLVSPFTLGISSAASFGASFCIVFGTGIFFQSNLGIVSCAFLSAICCGILVYSVSQRLDLQPVTIVLIGIGMNYFFSAMTATIEFFAQEYKLAAVVQWTFGNLNKATWENLGVISVVTILCFCYTILLSQDLNVIATNDDETASSLGINTNRLRIMGGMTAILMTSVIISFTGVIGFVGLIAPHIARLIIGSDHKYYLPFSAISGAMLMLFADTIGKFILRPVVLPVGIVVSFIGVPVFINLIYNSRNRYKE